MQLLNAQMSLVEWIYCSRNKHKHKWCWEDHSATSPCGYDGKFMCMGFEITKKLKKERNPVLTVYPSKLLLSGYACCSRGTFRMSGEGTALITPPRWCPCSLSEPHVTTPTCSSPIDEVATAKRTTWCHLSTGNPSVICAALKVTPKLLWPLRSLRVVWPSEDSPTSWSNTFLLWGRHNGLLSCVSNKQAFLCPRQGGLGSQHPSDCL